MTTNDRAPPSDKTQGLEWALYHAASGGHTEIVRQLLRAGATETKTALQRAALNGHTGTVVQLLKSGADPGDDASPMAAWRLAASGGHRETVEALLSWRRETDRGDGPPSPAPRRPSP